VRNTIVDGVVRLRNGELVGVDEREIAARSRELAAGMWERF